MYISGIAFVGPKGKYKVRRDPVVSDRITGNEHRREFEVLDVQGRVLRRDGAGVATMAARSGRSLCTSEAVLGDAQFVLRVARLLAARPTGPLGAVGRTESKRTMTNLYRLPGATTVPLESRPPHTTEKCPSCRTTNRDQAPVPREPGYVYLGLKTGVFCRGTWWIRWRKGCGKGNHLHMECTKCGWRWIVWP